MLIEITELYRKKIFDYQKCINKSIPYQNYGHSISNRTDIGNNNININNKIPVNEVQAFKKPDWNFKKLDPFERLEYETKRAKSKLYIKKIRNEVIADKLKESISMEDAIDEEINYLLKEFAFILASPKIYNAPNVTYIYHSNWAIFQKLIAGEYDCKPKTNLSFPLSNID